MWKIPPAMDAEMTLGLAGDPESGRWHILGYSPTVVTVSLAYVQRPQGECPAYEVVLAEMRGPMVFASAVQDRPGIVTTMAVADDGAVSQRPFSWREVREHAKLNRREATIAVAITTQILTAWAYQRWPWWQMFLDGMAMAEGRNVPTTGRLYGEGKWMPGQPYVLASDADTAPEVVAPGSTLELAMRVAARMPVVHE